jgi:hypothetical protein
MLRPILCSLLVVALCLGMGGLPLAAVPSCPHQHQAGLPFTDEDAYRAQGESLACLWAMIFYSYSRALSVLAPEYSLTFDSARTRPGIKWELSYEFRRGGWRHAAFGSIAYYPDGDGVIGRLGYRLRVFSVLWPRKDYGLHAYLAGGGFVGDRNSGTLIEARLRFGWLQPAGGGVFLASAWELGLRPTAHGGETSAGIEFPF